MNQLEILITPEWGNETIESMEFKFTMPADALPNQSPMLHYPSSAFGNLCPFPEYEDLILMDDLGEVPYSIADAPSLHGAMEFKGIYPDRKCEGTLVWSYRAFPRILPEGYRSSPYYDFRNEPFGLNGSGFFSFILPNTMELLHLTLDWDLSSLPEGSRAIWSYGEGCVEKNLTPIQIGFSLFQVGLMNAVEGDSIGVYWFGNPDFDIAGTAEKLIPIFDYMKQCFHDTTSTFKVFLRRDPFEISNGGSACPYAFISGYSAFHVPDMDQWFSTLVHEMTHTWPYMDDTNVGTGTWFTEGCTEYFCTMLPYEGGLFTKEYTLACINNKAVDRYYRNPFRELANMQIPAIQWKERAAQTVPYGRGFIYLANVEAKLKEIGIDMRGFIAKYNWVRPMTQEIWENFILENLGDEGVREFHEMQKGKLIIPHPNAFGNAFQAVEETINLNGEMVQSWHFELGVDQ